MDSILKIEKKIVFIDVDSVLDSCYLNAHIYIF